MPAKILFVDDDPNLLAAFTRTYRKRFEFDTAVGGQDALRVIRDSGPYGVVVVDMTMPGMNGIELLEKIYQLSPDTVSLMLTGNADQATAVESINRGRVFRFLNKPCPPDVLTPALDAALHQFELKRIERELLEGTLMGSLKLLTDILGTVAPDALGRGQRLRLAISEFVRRRRIDSAWECEIAALLSAIGFAAVPPSVLQKIGEGTPLTLTEETMVRRVPEIGCDLLKGIPRLAGVAAAVLYQKKNFDGTGFPRDDRVGSAIPLGARLLRIFSDRLELEADGVVKERALAEMLERTGFYDLHLVEDCFNVFPNFLPNSLAGDRAVGSVGVKQLVPGLVIVTDIRTYSGLVIVGAGHTLTAAIIERVTNFAALGEVNEPILVQEAVGESMPAFSPAAL